MKNSTLKTRNSSICSHNYTVDLFHCIEALQTVVIKSRMNYGKANQGYCVLLTIGITLDTLTQ